MSDETSIATLEVTAHGLTEDQWDALLDRVADAAHAEGEDVHIGGRRVDPDRHLYISTGCLHKKHEQCRLTCKFCANPCLCVCHRGGGDGERTRLEGIA